MPHLYQDSSMAEGVALIITPDPVLREEALKALAEEYKLNSRRPGLHQSEISYCLTKSFWERTSPLPLTEKEILLFSIGFSMERVLLAREETPSELVLDGISCSLDTISLFGPADLKTTRKRAGGRKGEDGFQIPDGWKKQFMAYRYVLNFYIRNELCLWCGHESHYTRNCWDDCKCLGATFPDDNDGHDFAVVIVHLVEPEISAYRFQFSDQEMEENWSRLLDRSNQLESMLASNDPMPFTTNEDYECQYCRYKLMCELEASKRMFNVR